jgi:hypothetical protein
MFNTLQHFQCFPSQMQGMLPCAEACHQQDMHGASTRTDAASSKNSVHMKCMYLQTFGLHAETGCCCCCCHETG